MLQANPSLTPDQVKCRLISTAQSALSASGYAAYSVYQQGAAASMRMRRFTARR